MQQMLNDLMQHYLMSALMKHFLRSDWLTDLMQHFLRSDLVMKHSFRSD